MICPYQFPEMQLGWLADSGSLTLDIPYIIDPAHSPRVSWLPYTHTYPVRDLDHGSTAETSVP